MGSWFYSPKVCPGKASPGHTQGLSAPSTFLKVLSLSPTTTASERGLHGTGFVPSVLFLGGEDALRPRFRAGAGKGWLLAAHLSQLPGRRCGHGTAEPVGSPLLPSGPPCSPRLSLTGKPSHAAWLQPAPSREVFSEAPFMLAAEGLSPCGGLAVGKLRKPFSWSGAQPSPGALTAAPFLLARCVSAAGVTPWTGKCSPPPGQ